MKRLHIVPGVDDAANGLAVVARFLAKEQGEAEVVDLNDGLYRIEQEDCDEVWIHGMWLPKEWQVCKRVLKTEKQLVRMTHGSLSPICLRGQGKWKKCLARPIERLFLRRANCIVVTCAAEKEWVEAYLGKWCPRIEVTDLKRFFDLSCLKHVENVGGEKNSLHLLYLGRRHPLKGIEYLESAVAEIVSGCRPSGAECPSPSVELRIVSNVFGTEKDRVWEWCDVLVLPTLSENFGLVVAEALEHGKRVITTDGAPAWGDGNDYGGRLIYLRGFRDGTAETRVQLLKEAIGRLWA